MEHIVIGILAHVDAGKTTLSEALLYESGGISEIGRVDKGNAFLDTYALEKERGITIFSKQALLTMGNVHVTLLDTPGHVDFSAEMERTLQVLDYAVLVISGTDGVQGHTHTLWHLLARYQIPLFLFINKMDQAGTDQEALITELQYKLDAGCIDFSNTADKEFLEEAAVCDEKVLEYYLEHNRLEEESLNIMIGKRKIFPCYFGSALKMYGVRELMQGLSQYVDCPQYPQQFGAKIYKIARDDQGNRLTFMKVTGGSLKVRDSLTQAQEKVNQIRVYSGDKYQTEKEVRAGMICAVTGLSETKPGEGLGAETASGVPVLTPVLTYTLHLPSGCDAAAILPKLKQLEEEEPQLHIVWNEELQELQAQIMGEVQTEVIKCMVQDRFGITIDFGVGSIVYKETIVDTVEGIGHFEPLRHYAEVHLLLEPGERGSGLQFTSAVSEDVLDRNWQRLILTHLEEKEHKGVLTGFPITDMQITVVTGRAHKKHTEGGDFRQATYRALRQGLMQAGTLLLEPYYDFRMELPQENVGRAMHDIERMGGTMKQPETTQDRTVLTGKASAAGLQGYQQELYAFTKGRGRIFCSFDGYEPCHNAEEIIEKRAYQPEQDSENTADSVFCAHGAGYIVRWDQVQEHMHLESCLQQTEEENGQDAAGRERSDVYAAGGYRQNRAAVLTAQSLISAAEADAILSKTLNANKKNKDGKGIGQHVIEARRMMQQDVAGTEKQIADGSASNKTASNKTASNKAVSNKAASGKVQEEYLLVDGYNMMFAWENMTELTPEQMSGARNHLMDILCNYQAAKKIHVIVVFDAYRLQGHATEIFNYHNIHVVYTKEAETADQYIEKFAQENGKKYKITVATSDGLEQIITRGQGCFLLSARELQEEILRTGEALLTDYEDKKKGGRNYMFDSLDQETKKQLKGIGSCFRNI